MNLFLVIAAIIAIIVIIIGGRLSIQYVSRWWKSRKLSSILLPGSKTTPTPTSGHRLDKEEVEDLNKIIKTTATQTPKPEKEVDQKELEDMLRQQNPGAGAQ